jgi:hypothetical protein
MRLAAMTASSEEVEDLSRTLRMPKASLAEINQLASKASALSAKPNNPRPLDFVNSYDVAPEKNNSQMVLVVFALVALGIVAIILF